ncbi:polysaccharide biosynthesis C-terminal domain-containing protein [Enterobacter cloacae]|uniref:MATE family efflux transporter n=3 Tax=Enterobacter cloacae TaxID=550 RepID=UPI0011E8061D|nr:polysaccharide biosynthesis C-terminal domain-containing protein [Enterobacter cloacae]HCM9152585.1 polysaccharide biosynthesis C-terminal domain-containing protein [Enterobacter cloacae subsp. cloacae]ELV2779674.1 polysaccharide biosynthesis C-terminal domain-containing protein [Enterobacter cloacae]MCK7172457.1 polysaccharide biosynthesis C-terminal domain-containing protein [Enterobacter cloacae]MCM2488496.1 polysaccharide biosynthesis C-terminal domain-containing protein [Enterobacter cl
MFKKYFNSFFSLTLRMTTIISSFLFSWIVSRYFGAENAGAVFFYITLLTILVTFSSQGAEIGIAKASARIDDKDKSRINALFNYVLAKSYKLYLLIFPLLIVYLFYENLSFTQTLILIVALFSVGICFVYMNVLSYLYQGLGNILMMILSQRTLFNFLSFIIIALFCFVFTEKNDNYNNIALDKQIVLISFAGLIAAMCFAIIYKKKYGRLKGIFKPEGFDDSCRQLFRIQILQLITMYGSQIIINFFATKADIAGFIVSQRISTLLGFFVLAVSGVVSSQVSRAYSIKDFTSVQKYAFQSFVFSASLGIPVGIILITFAKEFLAIFGSDFIQFYMVLITLVISQMVNCLTGACDIVLMFIDGEKEHKRNVIIGTVIAICLSLILIPFYSAIGAAIAATVSAVIVNVLDVISIKQKAGFWIFNSKL